MALALYLAFLGAACAYALIDWRRGWMLVLFCGVLQDPVRKLTGGAPVVVSFAVVGLYAVILFSARHEIVSSLGDFARRFGSVYTSIVAFIFLLLVAAMNGVLTYGIAMWKVPLLSLFTYCIPLVAALFGYVWLQREEWLYRWFTLYTVATSIALVGTILEYLRVQSRILGMVSFEGDFIRHLPGIQIRLLSGIYRGPDVMAWHASMLACIAIAMTLRAGVSKLALVWGSVAAWGFFNCMIAGRRKAIYTVVVFCAVFVWRYVRRLKTSQVLAFFGVLILLGGVVRQLASGEETSVYAAGAVASKTELAQRLEGGAMATFEQFGLMGAGLGAATQGVYHLLGDNAAVGWQEGGLGKLAVEVGLPGILAILAIGWIVLRLLLRLTSIQDVPGSSQFVRVTLFALVVANMASFMASAQAYTDAVLALTTGFFVGCLFATAALDERLAATTRTAATPAMQPVTA
ncbi:MAG: hypothetical protein QOJ98_28 [Acidobacteriota bacterium]|jgi:hypothetical protein|nr:hypothetical protein [Acidobacteriota bacterium]